jgi:hypothetical protein
VHQAAGWVAAAGLEKQRDAASYQICQEEKTRFKPSIQRILTALNEIRAANLEIIKLRDALQAQGIRTDAIAPCLFLRIGTEQDHQLGQSAAALYQKTVTEDFGL